MPLPVSTSLRRWWSAVAGTPAAPAPFQIACDCGHVTTGTRRLEPQILACPVCSKRLFVLPSSRLPPVLGEGESLPAANGLKRLVHQLSWLGPWQLPLVAGGGTFLFVAAVLGFVLYESRPERLVFSERPEVIARRLQAGRQALSQGKFRIAEQELSAALSARQQLPQSLTLAERRQLTQLHRQASLLADLLAEPLEDVLRHAADLTELDEREWQETFTARYRGRSVVFEDDVRRDAAGRYQLLGYTVLVRGQPARLELGELELLRLLPLDIGQRLLFGMRLASVEREPPGTWIVHFQPDSGVLLTDFGAAAACCPLAPAELRPLLERQAGWLADLP